MVTCVGNQVCFHELTLPRVLAARKSLERSVTPERCQWLPLWEGCREPRRLAAKLQPPEAGYRLPAHRRSASCVRTLLLGVRAQLFSAWQR